MNLTLSLFALSLLGAEGPRAREAPVITYDVRVLNMNGLEWRGAFFSRLQPVTSHAGTTVWTASRATAQQLSDESPSVVGVPRVTAASRAPATISDRTTRKVASGVTRQADGPFDHATQVAYTPSYQDVREGFMITMAGRQLDQGVLAFVVIDETRVANVHRVTLTENVAAKEGCAGTCDKIAPRLDVPEFAHASVDGEWLIPNDGALVISLGVQTKADPEGKAVVAERLVLIEARPAGDAAVQQASMSRELVPTLTLLRGAAGVHGGATIPMPMPALPARSLPQATAADGTTIPLPPLPEGPATPATLPGSSEPCASPQLPHRPAAEPTTLDPASAQAGFIPEPKPEEKAAKSEPDAPARQPMVRIPLTFQLNGAKINVEIELPASTMLRNVSVGKGWTPSPKTPQQMK